MISIYPSSNLLSHPVIFAYACFAAEDMSKKDIFEWDLGAAAALSGLISCTRNFLWLAT